MAGRMRVVMLTTSFPRWEGDAAGHFVASLAQELVRQGHEVSVLAPHAVGALEQEQIAGVCVRRFRYAPASFERIAYGSGIVPNVRRNPLLLLVMPAFISAMRRALRAGVAQADVVHVHWAPTAALALSGKLPVPVVLTLHGSDTSLAARGRVWRWLLERGLAGAHAVSVVARSQVRVLEELGYGGAVEVIPAGVDETLVSRARPVALARPRILYVGRLIESKGVLDLLEAFLGVQDRLHDAELVFVGDGPLLGELRSRCASAGVGSRVVFEGEVAHERALDLTASADLLVLPSYAEGSPLSVTEALAVGTPVLGTSVGAVPELVGDAGAIVAPGDRDAIERALVDLLSDRERLARMGDSARPRVAASLTWPALARATAGLYRAVATGWDAAR